MFPIRHRERRGKKSWRPKSGFVCRLSVVISLVLVSAITVAQDWVEQSGQEFNCDVLTGILEDYGEREMVRAGARTMTVKEMFAALFFPSCPAAGEATETASKASAAGVALDATAPETLFSFSSAEHGLQPVLGPLSFPAGIYVFTASTNGFLALSPNMLSDNCGWDLQTYIFNLTMGRATQGAQSIVEVESDCDLLLEIDNATETWQIEIVPAQSLDSIPLGDNFATNSGASGLRPVIGPLSMSAGLYVFTAATDGFMALMPQTLSEDCGWDLETPIFNLSMGKAKDGAQSVAEVDSDCLVLLEIGNTTDSWLLEINKLS